MANLPHSPHQNALTLDEYESLTSARAEFVDFLLGAADTADDDGGKAADDGGTPAGSAASGAQQDGDA